MSYAGNPSLAPDVQKRILDTFRHTLDVAARGSLEEARLGCDFVLQLDPQFLLARALADRLQGAAGAVAVDDLRASLDGDTLTRPVPSLAAAPPQAPAAAPRPTAPGPPRPAAPAPPRPAAAASPAAGAGLRQELGRLLAARDFAGLMARAQQEQATIAADAGLQQLLGQAQELMEAAPYVDRFLSQAQQARAAGRADDARALLDKARALDPAHPALAQHQEPAAPPPAFASGAAPGYQPDAPLLPDDAALGELGGDEGDELPMDLPPLELPDIEELPSAEELSLEGLAGESPLAAPAAAGGASDPDPRIAELLDEGQAQFQRGDLQGAIDAWSRIFLIDIDHHEAARRIDAARNAKAEQERVIEEAYQDALAQVQAKDWEGAKTALQRVLEQQPNHMAAREMLAKLESGEVADLSAPSRAKGESGLLGELTGIGDEELKEEILVPPEPGEERARPDVGKPRPAPSRQRLLVVAAGVLVLLLAGGWFLMSRWQSIFPNTDAASSRATPAVEQTPITRATELYKQGKRAVAIAQLKRVPPASPYYEEAQALIGQWQQEEARTQAPGGPSSEQLAKRDALVEEARRAAADRHFLAVGPLLAKAAAIAPLTEDEQALSDRAQAALEPLKSVLSLLRAEEYDRSLHDLWVVLEKDSGNADARLMLTTAYYNKGIISLQQGKPDDAEENLKEAASLTPDDVEVQRLLQLAQTYKERTPDLLYRIYTKYLNPRPL